MSNQKTDRDTIIFLNDLSLELHVAIEKACCIMQDLVEGYLGKDAIKTEDDKIALVCDYKDASTRAFIASDYLSKIRVEAEKLERFLEEA